MRFEQEFTVARAPEDVFAFISDPDKLARWQTTKTFVRPLSEGPPRLGYRVREGTKIGPREWEQTVEFTEFEPGRAFGVRVVDGPESGGRWTFQPEGAGTRVHAAIEAKAPPLLGPLFKRALDRQFRGYHENLRRELERGVPA
jgi:uncharacterized protein YndB with AHSA1/START domain